MRTNARQIDALHSEKLPPGDNIYKQWQTFSLHEGFFPTYRIFVKWLVCVANWMSHLIGKKDWRIS